MDVVCVVDDGIIEKKTIFQVSKIVLGYVRKSTSLLSSFNSIGKAAYG